MQDDVPEDATFFTHCGREVEIILSDATFGRCHWYLLIDGAVHTPGDVGPAPSREAAILEAQVGARFLIDSGAAGAAATRSA